MGAVHGWMDENEVRRLAEGLMAAAPAPVGSGYGDDFVGFAELGGSAGAEAGQTWAGDAFGGGAHGVPTVGVPNQASGALARASERAREAGLLGPLVSAGEALALSPAGRLAEFRGWLTAELGTAEIFLLDREGEVVFDGLSQSKAGDFARSLARGSRSAGRDGAAGTVAVHLKLGHAAILEIFPLEIPGGRMVMAVVVPVAMASAVRGRIAVELAKSLGDERRG
jgi:hypothetical protein